MKHRQLGLFIYVGLMMSLLTLRCADPIWQKVDAAKRQGNLPRAAAALENHVRLHPSDSEAFYHLGEIRAHQERWEDMVAAFDRSLAKDRRWQREIESAKELYWTQNFNRGLEALELSNHQEAIGFFKNAIVILPQRALAHRLLGETALAAGDREQAVTSFTENLRLDAGDHRARRHLMMIRYSREDYFAAIREAETLLKAFPGDVESWRIIAYSRDHLRDTPNATHAYHQLTNLSRSAGDFESFAAFLYRQGEYDKAIAQCQQAMRRGGDRIKNLRSIAQCNLMQQDFQGLITTANRILKIQDNNVDALQLLQIAHAALGEKEKVDQLTLQIEQIKSDEP